MYARRLQLANYGPIGHLDIAFPFKDDTPIPVLLIGENGSGKSILLSHIVNALLILSLKVCAGRIRTHVPTPGYNIQSLFRILPQHTVALRCAKSLELPQNGFLRGIRVDFEEGLSVTEIRAQKLKQEYECIPAGLSDYAAQDAWNMMKPQKADHFDSRTISNNQSKIDSLVKTRFEEVPAL